MTKREAVEECLKHWEFMAKTGTKLKRDYPDCPKTAQECFFCLHAGLMPTNKFLINCNKCAGYSYWTDKGEKECEGYVDSLFCLWNTSELTETRQLWASRIVWMIWLIGEHMDGRMGGHDENFARREA